MTTWSEHGDEGQLLTDPDLIEAAIRAEGPINFRFIYKGIPFSAAYAVTGQGAFLTIVGEVGILPFSAQSAGTRRTLLTIMEAANRVTGNRFRVNSASRIEIHSTIALEQPINAANLIVAAAQVLLPALPYLECIADATGGESPRKLNASGQ
jgi:hypothetical protein